MNSCHHRFAVRLVFNCIFIPLNAELYFSHRDKLLSPVVWDIEGSSSLSCRCLNIIIKNLLIVVSRRDLISAATAAAAIASDKDATRYKINQFQRNRFIFSRDAISPLQQMLMLLLLRRILLISYLAHHLQTNK